MRYLRLRFHDLSFHLLRISLHFLLFRYSHSPALFSSCLSYTFICFRLIRLELRTYIASDIYISNIYGQYLKSCTCIKTLAQHSFRNIIRISQHISMLRSRAYRSDYAFADTGYDCRLACTADQSAVARARPRSRVAS